MTITAGELINAALRKCGGVLAEGETPSSELSADALLGLNTLLDSWSAESLSVFSTKEQVVTWPANEAQQTFGPSGDLVGIRPVQVESSTYFKVAGISYGLSTLNEAQYNSIAVKSSSSNIPEYLFVNPTTPNITLKLFPVPTQDIEFHLVAFAELSQLPNLFEVLVLPPGYQRALIFNLACELCAEFGIEPPQTVQRIAMTSKRVLKGNNSKKDILEFPASLLGHHRGFNIYGGQ